MENTKKGLNISARSFVTAILVLLTLMILTYVLTFIIPGGQYARTLDESGNSIIDTAGGYSSVEGGIPFIRFILSPVLVLGAEGGGTLIAVIAFLLIIGGVFNALEKCGLMTYALNKIVHRFAKSRFKLLAVTTFFFMAMGAFIGSFEECVPLVPIVVALAVSLGWDALTGLSMSLLAVGCGFASGVCNPFTVGVAQGLAGLPMFSGVWLRAVSFVLVYAVLMLFLVLHIKKIEKSGTAPQVDFTPDKRLDSALKALGLILGAGILLVLSSGFITFLQPYTMIIVAVMFLIAGIVSTMLSGMSGKSLAKAFFDGLVSILPAVIMILMASAIKFVLTEANILDTILYWAVSLASTMPQWLVILFIYLIVLVMNFFISSGSAKAFLLIPLIVPIAQIFGISPQLCIVAFAFGDGFSNVLYPTNPVLLISLGLTGVSYGKWFKHTWSFQLVNLAITCAVLLVGLAVGY